MADVRRESENSENENVIARKTIVENINEHPEFFEDDYIDLDEKSNIIHEKSNIRAKAADEGFVHPFQS